MPGAQHMIHFNHETLFVVNYAAAHNHNSRTTRNNGEPSILAIGHTTENLIKWTYKEKWFKGVRTKLFCIARDNLNEFLMCQVYTSYFWWAYMVQIGIAVTWIGKNKRGHNKKIEMLLYLWLFFIFSLQAAGARFLQLVCWILVAGNDLLCKPFLSVQG